MPPMRAKPVLDDLGKPIELSSKGRHIPIKPFVLFFQNDALLKYEVELHAIKQL